MTSQAATAVGSTSSRGNRVGLSDQAIRRLSQRGGLARIHSGIFKHSSRLSEKFLFKIIETAVMLLLHKGQKTITSEQLLKSCEIHGIKMRGYHSERRQGVKRNKGKEAAASKETQPKS